MKVDQERTPEYSELDDGPEDLQDYSAGDALLADGNHRLFESTRNEIDMGVSYGRGNRNGFPVPSNPALHLGVPSETLQTPPSVLTDTSSDGSTFMSWDQ